MIDFTLTSEQKDIRNMSKEFAEENLAPGVIKRDEGGIFPKKEIKMMGDLGFMGMMVPEKWGGR